MCALFEVPSQVINNIFSLNLLFTEEGSVSFQDKQSNRWGGLCYLMILPLILPLKNDKIEHRQASFFWITGFIES